MFNIEHFLVLFNVEHFVFLFIWYLTNISMNKHTHTKLKNCKVKKCHHQTNVSPDLGPESPEQTSLAACLMAGGRGRRCLIWDAMLQKTLLSKHSRFPMSHLPVALPCSLRSSCVLARERLERTNKLCCFLCFNLHRHWAIPRTLAGLLVPWASTAGPAWSVPEPGRGVTRSDYFKTKCNVKVQILNYLKVKH